MQKQRPLRREHYSVSATQGLGTLSLIWRSQDQLLLVEQGPPKWGWVMLTRIRDQQKAVEGWTFSHSSKCSPSGSADRSSHGSWFRTELRLRGLASAQQSRVCGQPLRLDTCWASPDPPDHRPTGIMLAQQTRSPRTISDLNLSNLYFQTVLDGIFV